MPNIELVQKKDLSSFRRIAIGTWARSYDPSVYGSMEVPVDDTLAYIKRFREKTGRHLTLTHVMAKVAAACLAEMPDGNAILRFNKLYMRKNIGVFFQVAMKDPESGEIDLSGATLFDVEKKSLVDIVDEFIDRTRKIRKAEDPELEKTRSTFKSIPAFMLNFTLKMIAFLCYTLNLDLSGFGLPKDAFGSVMVTNIGSLGLDQAYVPLVPYSRVPLLIAVGAIRDVAMVEDGEIVARKMMNLSATFDHRVLDGIHASIMARVVRAWFADPTAYLDDLDALPGPDDAVDGDA
jgi:pyruvate/2-oxoglutarate dehydrogenase complex dihydrolipoamide acyltransferase (E2) component